MPNPQRLEKRELRLGFIRLTDCAPLVIAREKGFFAEEGLLVTLEAQANWSVLQENVVTGVLDGAHMLAGQPLASTIGIGPTIGIGATPADMVTAFSMDLNGNGITVSNGFWNTMQKADSRLARAKPQHPITAFSLRSIVRARKESGKPVHMGMVHPVSSHNYQLRYWLAAAGIHPGFYNIDNPTGTADADVWLSVTPPPQMPATLESGTIEGYSVGEPWNQLAVARNIGVPVIASYDIFRNSPEKVFSVLRSWAEQHPRTHVALIKALIRAGNWLDESLEHREEAARLLSRRAYVGQDYAILANSMTGTFVYQTGDRRNLPDFNVFFRYYATYPFYSDAIWFLTQMRRWGQIPEAPGDEWYHRVAKQVYRPDIYLEAARALLAEGKLRADDVPWDSDGYRAPSSYFIDGKHYDGRSPAAYVESFALGLKLEQSFVPPLAAPSSRPRQSAFPLP